MSDDDLPPTHESWGAPPPAPPSGGTPQPPANPYPQPGSFDQYAAPTPYGQEPNPYGTQPYAPAYGGVLPDHPSATTALVLGLVGVIGIFVCGGLTLVLSPFAWVTGSRAVQAIDAAPLQFGGREKAQAGRIMGIIGTVLLVLAVVLAIVGVVLLVAVVHSHPGTPVPTPNEQQFNS